MEPRSLREVLETVSRLEDEKRALLRSTGPVLRKMRRATGQSQEDVAQATGVSQAYLSMVENGTRTPSPETVDTIEGYLKKESHGRDKAKEAARKARGG